MKRHNKLLPMIFSKCHTNTHKVFFPNGSFASMSLIDELMTNFWSKIFETVDKRPVLTSQLMSTNCKTTSKCNTDSFGPVCTLLSVKLNCMHDSKLQRCVQEHKPLKVPRHATN